MSLERTQRSSPPDGVDGDRIGMLAANGAFSVREGPLTATWTLQAGGVADFQLEKDRIATLKPNGRLFAKDGPLTDTWTLLANGVTDFQLEWRAGGNRRARRLRRVARIYASVHANRGE